MQIHVVKTWPKFYEPLSKGDKCFDLRLNDRDYRVGDFIHHQEWDPSTGQYSGRNLWTKITYMLDEHNPCTASPYALTAGYAILSLKILNRSYAT